VAQLVEALRYKLEGCGFEFQWGHCLNPSGSTMVLESTQPLTEMSTFMCRLSRNFESFKLLEPSECIQAYIRIDLLFTSLSLSFLKASLMIWRLNCFGTPSAFRVIHLTFLVLKRHCFPLKRRVTLTHLVETVCDPTLIVRQTSPGVCVWPSSHHAAVKYSNADAFAQIARKVSVAK
jgi:hypothetical protein